jgi:hypothetical protein
MGGTRPFITSLLCLDTHERSLLYDSLVLDSDNSDAIPKVRRVVLDMSARPVP